MRKVMGAENENRVEDRARRESACLGRCLIALFGIPLGPRALLSLRPLMAS